MLSTTPLLSQTSNYSTQNLQHPPQFFHNPGFPSAALERPSGWKVCLLTHSGDGLEGQFPAYASFRIILGNGSLPLEGATIPYFLPILTWKGQYFYIYASLRKINLNDNFIYCLSFPSTSCPLGFGFCCLQPQSLRLIRGDATLGQVVGQVVQTINFKECHMRRC